MENIGEAECTFKSGNIFFADEFANTLGRNSDRTLGSTEVLFGFFRNGFYFIRPFDSDASFAFADYFLGDVPANIFGIGAIFGSENSSFDLSKILGLFYILFWDPMKLNIFGSYFNLFVT